MECSISSQLTCAPFSDLEWLCSQWLHAKERGQFDRASPNTSRRSHCGTSQSPARRYAVALNVKHLLVGNCRVLFTLVTLTLPSPFWSRGALLVPGLAAMPVIPDLESLSGPLLPSAWPVLACAFWLCLVISCLESGCLSLEGKDLNMFPKYLEWGFTSRMLLSVYGKTLNLQKFAVRQRSFWSPCSLQWCSFQDDLGGRMRRHRYVKRNEFRHSVSIWGVHCLCWGKNWNGKCRLPPGRPGKCGT